jgi:hypothetical protein
LDNRRRAHFGNRHGWSSPSTTARAQAQEQYGQEQPWQQNAEVAWHDLNFLLRRSDKHAQSRSCVCVRLLVEEQSRRGLPKEFP